MLENLEDVCVMIGLDDFLWDKYVCFVYVGLEIFSFWLFYFGKVVDVWSLGVVFFIMLVGRYLFYDFELVLFFGKICRGIFVLFEGLLVLVCCLICCFFCKEFLE